MSHLEENIATLRPEHAQPGEFHRRLTRWNNRRLQPGVPDEDWRTDAAEDAEMILVEGAFIERMRKDAEPWLADLPEAPEAFVAWFET